MNDAWPFDAPDPREALTAMRDERVDERSGLVSRRGVHNQTGGLVENHNVVVLVENDERNVFAANTGFLGRRHQDRIRHTRFDRRAQLTYRPGRADVAAANECLGTGAAQASDFRSKPPVETLASLFWLRDNLDLTGCFLFRRHVDYQEDPRAMSNSTPPSDDLMRERRLQRNLKIVVGGLGALILLGLGAVAVRVVGLATGSGGGRPASYPTAAGSPSSTVSFELPMGAKIVSISLNGNRLAIQHDGPSGPGITIVDAETGRRVVEMRPTASPPRD